MLRCIKEYYDEYGTLLLTNGKIYEFDKIGEDSLNEDAYVGIIALDKHLKERSYSSSSFYLKGDDDQYRYYPRNIFIDIQKERDNKIQQLGI